MSFRIVGLEFIILAMASPSLAEPPAKNDSAKHDLEQMRGTWKSNEQESLFFHTGWVKNERFPDFAGFVQRDTIRIEGDELRYGRDLKSKITITLGVAGNKKTISFKYGNHEPIVGIYELEKDALRICAIDPHLGGKKDQIRLPEKCGRTRFGWFVVLHRVKN